MGRLCLRSTATRAEKAVWGAAVLLIVARLFLLHWNRAEFTDSVIQLQLFENRNGYFPPVYPALAWILKPLLKDPILAGRGVSIVAACLVLPLLFRLGRALAQETTGLFAALFYAVSPVPWRWSLHAMGDSLFTLLFAASLFCSLELLVPSSRERRRTDGRQAAIGIFLGGIAALTRYQGLVLLPLGLAAACRVPGKGRFGRWFLLALVPWIAVPAWMRFWGFAHGGQFTERAPADAIATLETYGIFAWAFVRYAPTAFGFALSGLALCFAIRAVTRRASDLRLLCFALGIGVTWLAVHAAFQSFQYRYFLPLVPLLCVCAALGLGGVRQYARSPLVAGVLAAVTVVELGISTGRLLAGTRDTFGDFPEAAGFIAHLPRDAVVFSNELWNPGFLCPKMEYWSGRDIRYGILSPVPGGGCRIEEGRRTEEGSMTFEPVMGLGKVVCAWHNVYAPRQEGWIEGLGDLPGVRVLYRTRVYVNRPRLPDIMVDPPVTSLPEAMRYRERPQPYRSVILEVDTGETEASSGTSGR